MIKQDDAAALVYISNGISLNYTFVTNVKNSNTCIADWQPLDYKSNTLRRSEFVGNLRKI